MNAPCLPSEAEALKMALVLLKVAIREQKKGNSLAVVKGDTILQHITGLDVAGIGES